MNKSFTFEVEVWLWGFFPFSVQKLSEFLSSEEIGEEHDKSSELRSADNHSKYQAVVSKAVSLPVKWLQSFAPRINFSLLHFLLIISCNCKNLYFNTLNCIIPTVVARVEDILLMLPPISAYFCLSDFAQPLKVVNRKRPAREDWNNYSSHMRRPINITEADDFCVKVI